MEALRGFRGNLMNSTISRSIPTIRLSKLGRMRLSRAERKTAEKILILGVGYIRDPRFRRHSYMSRVMERDIEVLPGSTLTVEQELTLFLQMNYARHRISVLRNKLLRSSSWHKSKVQEILDWHEKQLETRSKIVTGNMGLVPAMVKRIDSQQLEFTDLLSEGSMALLRATEKFDCSLGWKFSTYACRAILKSFSRVSKLSYRYRSRFGMQLEPAFTKDDTLEQQRQSVQEELVDEVRAVMSRNLADLSGIEESIVEMRFSLRNAGGKPMTLKQVGELVGLTKERIRQIQNKALEKLRITMEERMVVN